MPRGESVGHPSRPTSRSQDLPCPSFEHLRALTDEKGVWEHARYTTPRREHGYCTDDNARALVVVTRERPRDDVDLADLAATYLDFVLDARTATGEFHNRRDQTGSWTDVVGSDDSQGRAVWGLGTAARLATDPTIREGAIGGFTDCATFESPHLRANAYAALGAAEVLRSSHRSECAGTLLDRTTHVIAESARATIPWPETRLTYDNARIAEALIVAGSILDDNRRLSMGLRLLDWLVNTETEGDHFSFTPVGGREPGGPRPAFDQQPLEAWAMTDATSLAWSVTGYARWRILVDRAASWLTGNNDTGSVLYDETTGATRDGLMVDRVNGNCGAESTIAGIGALQTDVRCSATSTPERPV